MQKTKLISLVILIVGLVATAILVTMRQLFLQKAFTPGPTSSTTANLYLSPLSGQADVGDIVPLEVRIRTQTPISAITLRASIDQPENFQIVNAQGQSSIQAFYPTTGLSNWSFPINNFESPTLDLAAINTSVLGFTSGEDFVIAKLYLKVLSRPSTGSLSLLVDEIHSTMTPKENPLFNIAHLNLLSTYTIGETQPDPTTNPSLTFSPGSGAISSQSVITAYLNTATKQIDGYQIGSKFTYIESIPPINILTDSLTNLQQDSLNCSYRNVNHDQANKVIQFAIICVTIDPSIAFSTSGQSLPIFSLTLDPQTAGSITLAFNTTDSSQPPLTKVIEHGTDSNILNSISSLTYSYSTDNSPQSLANLKFSFSGITSQKPNQSLRLTFRSTTQSDSIKNITFASDPLGKYSGEVILPTGTYDLLVKGPAHRQVIFPNLSFTTGQQSLDLSTTPLPAGDIAGGSGTFPFDNRIDILDYGVLSRDFSSQTPISSPADLNLDGFVNILDYGILSQNFNSTVTGAE
jgi:hypothetical protein